MSGYTADTRIRWTEWLPWIVALAGFFLLPEYLALGADILPVHWSYPQEHLVYFLIVVAVGGLGSLRGPFVAALLIGIADTACKYWIPEFGAFLVYAATIAVLLWRPQGLFGVRA